MEKLTFAELKANQTWKEAVIVFAQESFNREFSEEARSYKISSDAKYFDADKIGKSLFGNCLDGTDDGVRLDWYMSIPPNEGKRWKPEYCYIAK